MDTQTQTARDPGTGRDYNPCCCSECSPTRVHHWFCSQCGRGPFRFDRQRFFGSRMVKNARGDITGQRFWCSNACRLGEERTYLMAQLTVANASGNTETCRILNGQLAQLEASGQIPTSNDLPEEQRAPSPVIMRRGPEFEPDTDRATPRDLNAPPVGHVMGEDPANSQGPGVDGGTPSSGTVEGGLGNLRDAVNDGRPD